MYSITRFLKPLVAAGALALMAAPAMADRGDRYTAADRDRNTSSYRDRNRSDGNRYRDSSRDYRIRESSDYTRRTERPRVVRDADDYRPRTYQRTLRDRDYRPNYRSYRPTYTYPRYSRSYGRYDARPAFKFDRDYDRPRLYGRATLDFDLFDRPAVYGYRPYVYNRSYYGRPYRYGFDHGYDYNCAPYYGYRPGPVILQRTFYPRNYYRPGFHGYRGSLGLGFDSGNFFGGFRYRF